MGEVVETHVWDKESDDSFSLSTQHARLGFRYAHGGSHDRSDWIHIFPQRTCACFESDRGLLFTKQARKEKHAGTRDLTFHTRVCPRQGSRTHVISLNNLDSLDRANDRQSGD